MRCLPAPLAMPPFRRHFTLFAEDRLFRARGARDALARSPAGTIVVVVSLRLLLVRSGGSNAGVTSVSSLRVKIFGQWLAGRAFVFEIYTTVFS